MCSGCGEHPPRGMHGVAQEVLVVHGRGVVSSCQVASYRHLLLGCRLQGLEVKG